MVVIEFFFFFFSRSSARTQEVANVGTSSSDLHLTDFTYETFFLQFYGIVVPLASRAASFRFRRYSFILD